MRRAERVDGRTCVRVRADGEAREATKHAPRRPRQLRTRTTCMDNVDDGMAKRHARDSAPHETKQATVWRVVRGQVHHAHEEDAGNMVETKQCTRRSGACAPVSCAMASNVARSFHAFLRVQRLHLSYQCNGARLCIGDGFARIARMASSQLQLMWPTHAQRRAFNNRSSSRTILLACPRDSSPNASKIGWSCILLGVGPCQTTTSYLPLCSMLETMPC